MSQVALKEVQISEVVVKADTWNPARDAANDQIYYIDLSSVDNVAKVLTGFQTLAGRDAPSRARQLVKAGDILVSTVRPNLNGVAKVPQELDGATASTGFCILRPRSEKIDTSFLFHWVQSPNFVADMERKATGASYPAVSDKIIFQSGIPLPPLQEQKRIAATLDQADELRRKRQRAIERINQLGQAIFHEMFGDLKLEPKRWENLSFLEACSDETSKSEKLPRGSYLAQGEYAVVDQGQSKIAGWCNDASMLCQSDLPVVVFGDHTRAVKYVDFPFVIGADGAKVLAPSNCFNPVFFCELLRQLPIPDLGYSRHMREVKRLCFPCPPQELQNAFAEQVSSARSYGETLATSESKIASLFGALQSRAFRGEL